MNADTHSEYGILIAFTQQKSSRERASMLCLHLRCPVVYVNVHTVESDVIKLKTSNLQIHTHTYTHTHTPHTHTTDTTHTPHTHTHTHIHTYIYISISIHSCMSTGGQKPKHVYLNFQVVFMK